MRPQRSSLIIRGLILSALTLNSFSTFSQTNKVQVFNQYNDIFRVQNINFDHQVVSFSGSIKVNGKVIFEIREDDPGKPELYKAAFIPYDIDFFPYITDGYYPKKLIKIDLVNLNDAKKIIFSEQEWQDIVNQHKPYITRYGTVEITNYTTSIECDSRQYYAKLKSFKAKFKELTFSENNKIMIGC